ncbi:hypothetical protein AVEN_188227-1 [Araneus ventricosus]|uniref:Uncharacterized protein n=1 Tax=Araneus ventricosus TaxID=182803 RepID=A0A4Y2WH08_ARAVE|nr:hypothetical protein AVEN_48026-1 [Araneus ventricosus]GBO35610.1 hypothetical protein AVEN_188227-1 [Araneus ventricosus]
MQKRIFLRDISGYSTISYKAVFAISGFPPIDIFNALNRDFKIAAKTYIANNQDVCLPHSSERSPINLVSYYKNIEGKFPVVCLTDGSKINSKDDLAFVDFRDYIEIEVHQFRIRDKCSALQAELICIA